jgi:hypothetical protein
MDTLLPATRNRIEYLRHLLQHIPWFGSPGDMQNGTANGYDFDSYSPDEDRVRDKDYGLVGAVNRDLEIELGHRASGPLRFGHGRGPGLVALADVLARYLAASNEDFLLSKWLDDCISGAETVYSESKAEVSSSA